MLLKKYKALFLLLFPLIAQGGQWIPIVNNGEAIAQIARDSLSRVYVQNDRIIQITSMNGELMIQKDLENGQLFIKPIDEFREKPINVFLSTEKGNHFSLSFKPLTIKSQTIGLYTKESGIKRANDEKEILAFMKELQQEPNSKKSFSKEKAGKIVFETPYKLIQSDTLHKGNYVGEVYKVENHHQDAINLQQSAFWQSGVKAVAIEKENLLIGQATKVFVVKENG
jgi:type-F conjugative transfer system secretin TraK